MNEDEIQKILERLGTRVSLLSEENRLCKLRDDAGKELFTQLGQFISRQDWINLFESCKNIFVKDIMKEWGSHLFPDDYKYN